MVQASLRDPATGQVVQIMGVSGHDIVIRHRPRVPVLDVPAKTGDAVQHLGRKSRIVRVRRGLAIPSLLPSVVIGQPGLVVITPLLVGPVVSVLTATVTVVSPFTRTAVSVNLAEVLVAGTLGPVGGLQSRTSLSVALAEVNVSDGALGAGAMQRTIIAVNSATVMVT